MAQLPAILLMIAGIVGAIPINNPHRSTLAWALVFVAGLLMIV